MADKERGSGRAFLSHEEQAERGLDQIAEQPSREERLVRALRAASGQRLRAVLVDQIKRLNTEGALRVSAELTARGVAPCFRGIPVQPEWWLRNAEADFILMCADLQWIVARYPHHVPDWERARAVFDPRRFKQAARYLHWDGQRTPGQIAKALALSEEQQRECAWIQCLHIERWRYRLLRRQAIARARIVAAVRESDKRSVVEQDATIRRRSDLWLCAELADWKPQRTANLYRMLTGQALPRNVVAKQLAKLPKVRRTDELLPS